MNLLKIISQSINDFFFGKLELRIKNEKLKRANRILKMENQYQQTELEMVKSHLAFYKQYHKIEEKEGKNEQH